MEKILINRTGHVVIDVDGGAEIPAAKAEDILRVNYMNIHVDTIMDANIYEVRKIVGGPIPKEEEGKVYIVSKQVSEAMHWRKDFVHPGRIIHDENGNMVGSKGFSRYVNTTEEDQAGWC